MRLQRCAAFWEGSALIDTKALRSCILDLAIQGKLTEQLAEDGTAEELFAEIQAVKQRLIKEGKIKPEKPLPGINPEKVPFEIPKNWKWVRLGGYVQKVTDQVASGSFAALRENVRSLKTKDYAIMVKTADFANNFTKNLTYTDEHGYNFLSNSNLFGGELILSNVGSIGKCFIVPELPYKMTLAPNAVMIRLVDDAHRTFLYYYILSKSGQTELHSITTGIAMLKFNKTELKKIHFPLPPLAEQKRIVARVEEVFRLLDTIDAAQQQYTADAESLKAKLITAGIQGKLTEQLASDGTAEELYQQIQAEKQRLIKEGKIKKEKPLPEIKPEEVPFEIPGNWKWCRLIDIVQEKPSNGYSPKGVNYITDIKNLTLTATTSGTFKPDEFKYVDIPLDVADKYWLKTNDILIQRSNSLELVGTSCIYDGEDNTYIYPDLMMRMHLVNDISVIYISRVLKADYIRRYYIQNATGASSSMPKINQQTVSMTLIPLPPLAEQKRIAEKLDEVLEAIG